MNEPPEDADFQVQHHIAIALLRPDSARAQVWCDENLETDEALTWGRAYVIEPRHLEGVLLAIVDDGLSVRLRG